MHVWDDDRASVEAAWRFGSRVRKARERAGLTLTAMAARAGTSTWVARRIETGETNPSLNRMLQFAHAVEVPIEDLLDGLEKPTPIDPDMSAILMAMLAAPASTEWHGLGLARDASLKSGAFYPALARLERAGFLESRWEDEDWGRALKRAQQAEEPERDEPRRRLWRLTELGSELARFAPDTASAHRPHPGASRRVVAGERSRNPSG